MSSKFSTIIGVKGYSNSSQCCTLTYFS